MLYPKKILLIDHEPRITRLVRQVLESTGHYLIKEEHDDRFAIRCARWFHPDLIMVDMTMTGHNGEIVAKQLESDSVLKGTPLICLSTFVSEREVLSAGILSGYLFLASPIRIEALLSSVDQLLFAKEYHSARPAA